MINSEELAKLKEEKQAELAQQELFLTEFKALVDETPESDPELPELLEILALIKEGVEGVRNSVLLRADIV